MARYEELGYCPHNAMGCLLTAHAGYIWSDLSPILVYDEDKTVPARMEHDNKPLVEAIIIEDPEMSLAIAGALNFYFSYREIDINDDNYAKISIIDVVNINEIPGICMDSFSSYTGAHFQSSKNSGLTILQDDLYVVGIRPDTENKSHVTLYIFAYK